MSSMGLPDGVRERLLAAGANEDEIDRAGDDEALFTLAGDLVRRRDIAWMAIESVAAAAGTSVEEVERYCLLVGLPAREDMVPAWTVVGLESYGVAAAYAGDAAARAYHRVLAAAAANVAAAATALFLNDVSPRLQASEIPTADALDLVETMVTELIRRTPNGWEWLFRQHLLLSARRGRAEHEADLSRVAIAFVDLTDSTAWAERVSHVDHAAALSRFEDAAWSASSARGVRLVKMIGDEAMLVATDPRDAVEVAAAICTMAGADPGLPPARGAVGYGQVYARGGDYFGTLVNMVARAVKCAKPGHLVVTPDVAVTLVDSDVGLGAREPHTLRGIADPTDLIHIEVPTAP